MTPFTAYAEYARQQSLMRDLDAIALQYKLTLLDTFLRIHYNAEDYYPPVRAAGNLSLTAL